jgi:hypothetical protein
MVPVIAIDVGVEEPGVDDQCDGWASLERITRAVIETTTEKLDLTGDQRDGSCNSRDP